MNPTPFAIFLAFILVIYLFVRHEKSLESRPRLRKRHVAHLSHNEYIKGVIEEGNKKELAGRMRAEERERIRKDFYKL
jgi:hypothetical protein